MRKFTLTAAAIAGTLAAASPAMAATVVLSGPATTSGTTRHYTSGDVKFTATALTFTNGLNPTVSLAPKYGEGLGVNPAGDNRHTVDNSGAFDFILLRFDRKVALNGATFVNNNWFNDKVADTDASISFANVNYAALGQTYKTDLAGAKGTAFFNAAGAELYKNVFGSDTTVPGTSTRGFNTGANPNYSDVWVVGASITNLDNKIDSFKLKSVSYGLPPVAPGVPEPATWMMLILGMGTIGTVMRRRTSARLAFA